MRSVPIWRNDRSPLSPVAEEAFDVLTDAVDADTADEDTADQASPSPALSPDQAHSLLADAEFTPADAEYAIDRLLEQGYLYDVDGMLFITDPDR